MSMVLVMVSVSSPKVAHLDELIAKFWTNVTHVDVFEGFVGFHIPDLNNKRMRSVVFTLNYQLRHYDGVVCGAAQRANPPFRSRQVWGVKHKSLVLRIPCGSSLEPSHVRSVTQLSLRIAANNLVSFSGLQKELVLLWGSLIPESDLHG